MNRLDSIQITSPRFVSSSSSLVVSSPCKAFLRAPAFAKAAVVRSVLLSVSLSREIFDCVITSSLCCLSYGRVCRYVFPHDGQARNVMRACVRTRVYVYTRVTVRFPLASRCRRISSGRSSYRRRNTLRSRLLAHYTPGHLHPPPSRRRRLASWPRRHQLSRRLALIMRVLYTVFETLTTSGSKFQVRSDRETLLPFPRRVDFSHLLLSPLLRTCDFAAAGLSTTRRSRSVAITLFSAPWQQRRLGKLVYNILFSFPFPTFFLHFYYLAKKKAQ